MSQDLVGASWSVLHNAESLSDHRPILIRIETKDKRPSIIKFIKKADTKTFVKNLDRVASEYWGGDVGKSIHRIEESHRKSRKPV